jgi:hypothetical protein
VTPDLRCEHNTLIATRLFPDYPTWSKCPPCNPSSILEIDKSEMFSGYTYNNSYHTVFVIGTFPVKKKQTANQSPSLSFHWGKHAIAWHMLQPTRPKDRRCWKSTEHFSTLPYGWIPADGADFFALFVRGLKVKWLDFGVTAQRCLSQYVSTTSWSIIDMNVANHSIHMV